MSKWVLDASALLALLFKEPGHDSVARAIGDGASISTVNLSEVVAKLSDVGMPTQTIHDALDGLGIDVVDFNFEQAYRAGGLRVMTRPLGLSLGDRACLTVAEQLGLPAITTDHAWERLTIGISVRVAR
ncbi:MAG TPA: type II toxin-antitoxin system VapC family toxin [Chloroflexota bacterium]|nr:type II toxin-antitoxin system VapC family toxin [Chloroflexota bacterium]